MTLSVKRESDNTSSRHVVLTQADKNNNQHVIGSSDPLVIVDVNHLRLHEGRGFLSYYINATLATGTNLNLAFASASGIYPHITVGAFCGGDATLYFYENATATGGSSFTPVNRNRNSTTTSNVAITNGPTVSATGTLLYSEFLPGGTKKKAGGTSGESLEFVCKPLTTYLVRMTNTSAATQVAEITMEWYE